ncbi:hypothetical protein EV360DRAFT_76814, partial [Lentinula raphanica]
RAMNEAIWTFIVDTNQPISIIEGSSFKHMINVAALAKDGVILPDRKSTRNGIMKMFYKRMEELKALFAASNTDSYLAVTAHWIEIESPMCWKLRAAVIGFVRLVGGHTGGLLASGTSSIR